MPAKQLKVKTWPICLTNLTANMYKIEYSNRFKRDWKVAQKRNYPMLEIKQVIKILASGEDIPEKYKNHQLKGSLRNKWDLHIRPDWILLYTKDDVTKIIKLVRTGTHADLFK